MAPASVTIDVSLHAACTTTSATAGLRQHDAMLSYGVSGNLALANSLFTGVFEPCMPQRQGSSAMVSADPIGRHASRDDCSSLCYGARVGVCWGAPPGRICWRAIHNASCSRSSQPRYGWRFTGCLWTARIGRPTPLLGNHYHRSGNSLHAKGAKPRL